MSQGEPPAKSDIMYTLYFCGDTKVRKYVLDEPNPLGAAGRLYKGQFTGGLAISHNRLTWLT